MDDAIAVSVRQRFGNVPCDAPPDCLGHRAISLEPGAKRLAVDQRHHVIQEAGSLTGIMEWENVWVLEPRSDLYFPQKPLDAYEKGDVRVKDLEGDITVMSYVVGEPDGRHPAASELTLKGVAVGERHPHGFE